jgi:hypothetical protein
MDIVHLAFMVSPLLGAAAGYLVGGSRARRRAS